MGVVVNWTYAQWALAFPEFSNVTEAQAQGYYTIATSFVRNDGSGPVNDPNTQLQLLNFAIAHIAFLLVGTAGTPTQPSAGGSSLVGRISSANEGTVSVSTEMTLPEQAAFWSQSQYGVFFWQLSSVYRTMRYMPGRQYTPNPFWGLYGRY